MLFSGWRPTDAVKLFDLRPGAKHMMMETQEVWENIIEPPCADVQCDVMDDFDVEEDDISIEDR